MRKNSNNDTIEIPKLHEVIENVRINMQLRKKVTKRGSTSSSTATSTPTTSEKSTSSSSNYSTPIKKEMVDLTNDNDGWIDSAKEFDEPASTTSMKPPKKESTILPNTGFRFIGIQLQPEQTRQRITV